MRIVLNDSIRVGKILFEKGDILSIPDRSQKELDEKIIKLAGKDNYFLIEDLDLHGEILEDEFSLEPLYGKTPDLRYKVSVIMEPSGLYYVELRRGVSMKFSNLCKTLNEVWVWLSNRGISVKEIIWEKTKNSNSVLREEIRLPIKPYTYKGKEGFLLSGEDKKGKNISIFFDDKSDAEKVRDYIKAGYYSTKEVPVGINLNKKNEEVVQQILGTNKFIRVPANSQIRLENKNKIEKIKRKEWI